MKRFDEIKVVFNISVISERNPLEETERSLQTLIKLASNSECVPSLIDGLGSCVQSIMAVSDQSENATVDHLVMALLNQIIQVSATC